MMLSAVSRLLCVSVQANNVVVKKSVHPAREEGGLLNHVDLVQLLDIVDLEAGTTVAGKASAVAVLQAQVMPLLLLYQPLWICTQAQQWQVMPLLLLYHLLWIWRQAQQLQVMPLLLLYQLLRI